MARKIPDWLRQYFDKGTIHEKFGSDASMHGKINGKTITVWYHKWYSKVYYKYKVNDYQRSPDILQIELEKRLAVIKG